MDPNPSSFPILSYVLARLPSLRSKSSQDEYDIEQPAPTSSSSSPPHEILSQHPKLANPKLLATLAKAVSDIAQSRSVLQTLGPRPDHESVEFAKKRIAEIDANLSKQLGEIVLSPRPTEVDRKEWRAHLSDKETSCRHAAEKEKDALRTLVQIDDMHASYESLLKEAESKLVAIYEKTNLDDDEIDDTAPQESINEEVVGILSSTSDSLEVVDLSNRKLRLLPEAFGRMSGLRVFNLSSNQLTMIPDSICALKKLEDLNLASNLIESLPDSIGLLTALKYLNVSGNKLTSLPDTICECRSLETFDASFNSITYLPTNIGHGLVNLKRLNLQLNKLRKFPISICEMGSLQHLDAHFNEIRNLPESFGKLASLETLNLSSNFSDLTELPFFFGELTNLKDLDLSNNQITCLAPTFGLLENLSSLKLDQNPLVVPPEEVVKEGCEEVKKFMMKKWVELLEEEERAERQNKEEEEIGWLKRSGSWLKHYASGFSETVTGYLSPRTPRVPYLDQQL